ncbi:MAG: DDE-type integrase/transposase/recombinase [Gammaproteobacteria bacterium]|nr:DDE-type integrase/transposase/recombinase [Gammaproteobacteria bacterium]
MSHRLAVKRPPHLRVVGATEPDPEPPVLSARQEQKQYALVVVMRYVRKLRAGLGTDSMNPSIDEFVRQFNKGLLPVTLLTALVTLRPTRIGACPDRATLYRWDKQYTKYLQGERLAGAPKHKGSQRQVYEWEPRALHYLYSANDVKPAWIAKMLQQEGIKDATPARVRSWHKTLPADVRNNRSRLGDLKYDSTQRPYVRRTVEHIAVGDCYQSDGNMMPIYLQHPTGQRPARYEITPAIDVRSRYLAGYWLSESESAVSTLHALTDAIIKNNHVPLDVQADNGPGFSNKMVRRFYDRLGIDPTHPRARNPKDNGYIERWHQTLQNEFLRRFPGYCGPGKSPEALKKYLAAVERGEIQLMTLEQFRVELDQFIRWYNEERIHHEVGGTPASLWQALQPRPPLEIEHAFFWDHASRVVQRCAVSLLNREYLNRTSLGAYNQERVIVEYNIYDDSYVRILDGQERWICDAQKIKSAPYRSTSAMEDKRIKAESNAQRRLDLKKEERARRAQRGIDADQASHVIEDMGLNNTFTTIESFGTEIDPFGSLPEFEPARGDRLDANLFDPFEP